MEIWYIFILPIMTNSRISTDAIRNGRTDILWWYISNGAKIKWWKCWEHSHLIRFALITSKRWIWFNLSNKSRCAKARAQLELNSTHSLFLMSFSLSYLQNRSRKWKCTKYTNRLCSYIHVFMSVYLQRQLNVRVCLRDRVERLNEAKWELYWNWTELCWQSTDFRMRGK